MALGVHICWSNEDHPIDCVLVEQDLLDVTDCVGSVKVGLRTDEINALPRLSYADARKEYKSSFSSSHPVQGVDQCVVCLEEYTDSEATVIRLPCSHLYHPSCIEQWLKMRKVIANTSCSWCFPYGIPSCSLYSSKPTEGFCLNVRSQISEANTLDGAFWTIYTCSCKGLPVDFNLGFCLRHLTCQNC